MTTAQPIARAGPEPLQLTIGQAKRVLEWWSCSSAFRDLVMADPERAGQDYKLGFNPDIIRPLWDQGYHADPANAGRPLHPVVTAYRNHYDKNLGECT